MGLGGRWGPHHVVLVDQRDVHVSGDDPAQQSGRGQRAYHGHEDACDLVRQVLNGGLGTGEENDKTLADLPHFENMK